MKQLSGLDAAFIYTETATQYQHIGGLGIYEQSALAQPLRFKEVLEHVQSRVHLSPGFRSKLARVPFNLGLPYWVEDSDFDVEFHVRHVALTKPQDWRQLMIDVSRLHARPIDLRRPPWELWVIEGLDNVEGIAAGSFGLLFKLHHSAVDGISAWDMVDAIHDREPNLPAAAGPAAAGFSPAASPVTMLARAAMEGVLQPLRLARTLYDTLPIVRETLYRGLRQMPLFTGTVPWTRLNRTVGAHRVHDCCAFSLQDLRRVRALVPGATVNDVVIAGVGGALRRYLDKHGELPEASLVAGCPVSIRVESARGTGGNKAVFAMVGLGTDIADPVERLQHVRQTTAAKKEFMHAVPAAVLTEYAQYMPGLLAGLAANVYGRARLANWHRPFFNTIVTNIPGSTTPLYFAGAKMTHYDAWGPVWNGLGVIHPVTSYNGRVMVSFDGDRDQLPDPDFYRQCLEESFGEMLATEPSTPPGGG